MIFQEAVDCRNPASAFPPGDRRFEVLAPLLTSTNLPQRGSPGWNGQSSPVCAMPGASEISVALAEVHRLRGPLMTEQFVAAFTIRAALNE